MTYLLDFSTNGRIYFFLLGEIIMIDIYDSEAIVKTYRMLNKKCEAIDKFINNHAFYFGPTTSDYGSLDVCNNIIDLIERKNQLINLKVIVDNAIRSLDIDDKKILYIKMKYSISISELCGILELKERTAFRHIERAFAHLTDALNNSKYIEKLMRILDSEIWISDIREEIRERRMAFKRKQPLTI